MRRYGLALMLLLSLVQLGSALGDLPATPINLSSEDFFIIFLAGIVYVNVFLVVLYKIFKSTTQKKSQFVAINVIGVLAAFILIATGYILIIYSGLVVASIYSSNFSFFSWAYYMLIYYLGSVTFGLLVTGAFGFSALLAGLYILVSLRGNPFVDKSGMPGKTGSATEYQVGGGEEPVNPNVTFRVIHRDTDEPAIDVKLILQQRDGSKIYEKYTDFNGEATIQTIAGHASQYYAYVQGDETRSKYRVIRSRTSDSSGS